MASPGKIPRFRVGRSTKKKRGKPATLNQRTPPAEHTKREFEQKVAKVTKGIRVGLGGGWRHPAKSLGFALDVQRKKKGGSRPLSTSERRQRNTQKENLNRR